MDVIRVAAYVMAPYVYPCFLNYTINSTLCPEPGVEITLLYEQLITLRFKPEFIFAVNETEMLNMVENDVADIAGVSAMISVKKVSFDVTQPALEDKFVFLVHRRKEVSYSSPNLLLTNCHWSLWLVFLGALFGLIFLKRLYTSFLNAKAVGPNCKKLETTYSGKLPLLAWSISFGIFLSVYSQYLAVTLIMPSSVVLPFNSVQSLWEKIRSDQCQLVVMDMDVEDVFNVSDYYDHTIYDSKLNDFFKYVYDHGLVVTAADEESFAMAIINGRCAYGMTLRTASTVYRSVYDEFETVVLKEMPVSLYGYYYKRSSPFGNRFQMINSGNANGIYEYHLKKISERNKRNRAHTSTSEGSSETPPLRFAQMQHVFIMLGSGLAVGSVLFGAHYFGQTRVLSSKRVRNE